MAPKRRNRRPTQKIFPEEKRNPRGIRKAEKYQNDFFVWSTDIIDKSGRWSWNSINPHTWWNHICPAINNFRTMKWSEILGRKHHFVDVDEIIPDARSILEEIYATDCLCSLAIGGKKRIWGIKDCNFFRVLWWDPNHEICPSPKRHT